MSKKSKQKQTRNTERLTLPDGCQCTQPYISPANWQSSKASVKKPWSLRFIFYDPIRRPNGKSINWEGMNGQKTWETRQAAAQQLLENVLADLKNGYNPVIKKLVPLPATPEHRTTVSLREVEKEMLL